MTQLPEPNFIERNPETITKEWVELYEQKSGKVLQPAQIERLMVDVGAYRETILRMKIQETAKQNLWQHLLQNYLQQKLKKYKFSLQTFLEWIKHITSPEKLMVVGL
jgi:hypothetical protein